MVVKILNSVLFNLNSVALPLSGSFNTSSPWFIISVAFPRIQSLISSQVSGISSLNPAAINAFLTSFGFISSKSSKLLSTANILLKIVWLQSCSDLQIFLSLFPFFREVPARFANDCVETSVSLFSPRNSARYSLYPSSPNCSFKYAVLAVSSNTLESIDKIFLLLSTISAETDPSYSGLTISPGVGLIIPPDVPPPEPPPQAANANKLVNNIDFFILFPFLFVIAIKQKNHQIYGGRGVHKSISQDSIGLSGKPYCITNGSPTCNRSGINNDTNTRKHGFNDVLYSHRTYWACDSPKPYSPP